MQGNREIQISLEDLRTLKHIVLESAAANSLDPEIAFRRFADDLLINYDVRAGLDKKITIERSICQQLT